MKEPTLAEKKEAALKKAKRNIQFSAKKSKEWCEALIKENPNWRGAIRLKTVVTEMEAILLSLEPIE